MDLNKKGDFFFFICFFFHVFSFFIFSFFFLHFFFSFSSFVEIIGEEKA